MLKILKYVKQACYQRIIEKDVSTVYKSVPFTEINLIREGGCVVHWNTVEEVISSTQ